MTRKCPTHPRVRALLGHFCLLENKKGEITMKKMICLLMIAVLLFSLIACGKEENKNETPKETAVTTPFSMPPSDGYNMYEFDSYEAIYKAMCDSESEDHKMLVSEGQRHIETYQNPCLAQIMEAFEDGTASLIVPATKEGLMPFEEREMPFEERKIMIMSRDGWELTWIWYHCMYNDQYLRIEVTYPSALLSEETLENAETATEVMKILMPQANRPDKYILGEYLFDIYEQEITIGGTKVTAIVQEVPQGTDVIFMWEGALVTIVSYAGVDVLTDEFWEDFRVQVYNG